MKSSANNIRICGHCFIGKKCDRHSELVPYKLLSYVWTNSYHLIWPPSENFCFASFSFNSDKLAATWNWWDGGQITMGIGLWMRTRTYKQLGLQRYSVIPNQLHWRSSCMWVWWDKMKHKMDFISPLTIKKYKHSGIYIVFFVWNLILFSRMIGLNNCTMFQVPQFWPF